MNADKALELARKAYPNNEELRVAYMLGLNEGYELHKDEMMKEAVEGKIAERRQGKLYARCQVPKTMKVEFCDKVRVIIVKED